VQETKTGFEQKTEQLKKSITLAVSETNWAVLTIFDKIDTATRKRMKVRGILTPLRRHFADGHVQRSMATRLIYNLQLLSYIVFCTKRSGEDCCCD
jgi:hypothetical protein